MFLGQEVHYYMMYIAYYTELNLQLHEKNGAFVAKITNTRQTNLFFTIFALAYAANFCYPAADTSQVISRLLMQAFNYKMQLT